MKITFKLHRILDERGMSQRELSRQTGVRHPTINAICNNEIQRLPVDGLAQICEALECDIPDIMTLEKERPE